MINNRKNEFRNILLLLLIFFITPMVTSCSSNGPFYDSMLNENFETIRKSTYFEGREEILSREEFEGYKGEIVKAIKGQNSMAKIEKNVVKDKIIVTPYRLKLKDLSKDVTIFIDDFKVESKTENGMTVIILPGGHILKFSLKTPYYEETKEVIIDTAKFDSMLKEVSSDFGFKDVKITSEDENAFLVVNGNAILKLKKGLNTLKNVPSVPLEVYSHKESDQNYISDIKMIDINTDSVTLKLNKFKEAKVKFTPKEHSNSFSVPLKSSNSSSGMEGLKNYDKGVISNISALKLSAENETDMLNKILENTIGFQQDLAYDLNKSKYARLVNNIQKGSNMEFFIKNKIATEAKNKWTFTSKGIEKPYIIFTEDNKGYVEFLSKFTIKKGSANTEESETLRYHFMIDEKNNILFTRYEKIN